VVTFFSTIFPMKQTSFFLRTILSVGCLLISFSACKKDPVNQVIITDENVMETVAGSLARDSRGLMTQIDDAARWTQKGLNSAAPCTYVKDSTFSVTHTTGSDYTYSFAFKYHTDIQCTNNQPTVVHFSTIPNGSWENTRSRMGGNGNGAWNILGVTTADDQWLISGSFNRAGNCTAKNDENKTFSNDLRMTLMSVAVRKSDMQVQSGTIAFTMTGASSSTDDYDTNGTITISNHTQATIKIGTLTKTINLDSGAMN
jgi:hypothetical protein